MGTDFVFGFPQSYGSSRHVSLYIVSTEASFSGYIESSHDGISQNFSTTSGFVDIQLPEDIEMSAGTSNKGIYVKTSVPVAVYGLNHGLLGEGFSVLPLHFLGTFYNAAAMNSTKFHSFLSVIGTTDLTKVQIKPITSIRFNGESYSKNDTITVPLDRLETLQIVNYGDLSGTVVNSSKPVAVMSGHMCTFRLPTKYCSHVLEFLSPSNKCGSKYVIPPSHGVEKMIRMYPSIDGTNVSFRPASRNASQTFNVNTMLELPLDSVESYTIISNHPICVFVINAIQSNTSGSIMTFVPSIDQFVNDVVFPRPTFRVYNNYLSIVMKSSLLPNLRINNRTVHVSKSHIAKISLGNMEYSTFWTVLPNDTDVYHVWGVSSSDVFGGLVYGSKDREAYGYPVGLNLNN